MRRATISELKIDRSYVTNFAGLCQVIIDLGQRFGLKTIAERYRNNPRMPQIAGDGLPGWTGLRPWPAVAAWIA